MADFTKKEWAGLSSQQQYKQRSRIPSRRPVITDLKKVLKQRSRTNNKEFKAKRGAPVYGQTGVGGFSYKEVGGSSGGLQPPFTETARTVKEHSDGEHTYRVAVMSTFTDNSSVEFQINWLDPDSSAITLVT
ncbi:MAG: hypothetical protein GY942_00595 [Aestuariibacter sp.]|nr:hypothetical protein [Aestuariibacter sp.]